MMKALRKIILVTGILLIWMCADAQTTVSGSISTNTTWDTTGSPYMVVGDIVIDTAVSLSIAPDVVVIFTGNHSLYVRGVLNAYGVNFSGEELGPGTHVFWNGISALSNANVVLNYCTLTDAYIALDYRQATVSSALNITHCNFRDNFCAVRATRNFSSGNISQSVFEHNLVAIDGSALDNFLDTTFEIDSTLMRYTNLISCDVVIDTCLFRDNKIAVNQVKQVNRSIFYDNGMGIKMTSQIDSCVFWGNKNGAVAFSAEISNSLFYNNENGLRLITVKDTSVGFTSVQTSSFMLNDIGIIVEPNARLGRIRCNYFDSNLIAIRTPAYLFMRHEDTGQTKGSMSGNVIHTEETGIFITDENSGKFSTTAPSLDSIRIDLNGSRISGTGIYIHNNSANDLNVFYLDLHSTADSMHLHLIDKSDTSKLGAINYSVNSRVAKTDPSNGNLYYEVTLDSMVFWHGNFSQDDTTGSKIWQTPSCYRNNFIGPSLGIKKTLKKEILLYPNPCRDKIYLQAENFSRKTSISIFSSDGRLVFETRNPDIENARITCTVDHLPPGIYYLLLQDEQGIARMKFVKE